ncbi:MAG: ZIP family metal transporter [Capsulimonadaceae bacterium]
MRTTIATLIAFIGAGIGVGAGSIATRYLKALAFAAMGVLLAVTLCDILPDAKADLSWPAFVLSVGSGWALFWLFAKYIGPLCPSCAMAGIDGDGRFGRTIVLLMLGLGLHSTMDGVAVAAGNEFAGNTSLAVMFAVSFHKLPEGLALAVLLITAGYSRRRALGWAWAIEATTEIGGILGVYALRGAPAPVLGAVFGHVGGGFLYLVLTTMGLIGHGHSATDRRELPLVLNGGVAFVVTAGLMWAFSHLGK